MGQKGSSEKRARAESPDRDPGGRCRGCCFPLLLATLQLLLGGAVAVVAFLMLTVSSSLLTRETPHWAGIILCVVSVLGFVLFCVSYVPDERTSLQFIIKLLYFLLSSIGLVVSVLVVAFCGHHHAQTSSLSCVRLDQDCVCRLDPEDPIARIFTYEGAGDCGTITGTLTLYFLIQIILNLVQAVVCAVVVFIMWKDRYQVFFAGLQIRSPSWQKV